MTVALVLATATGCDPARRLASNAAPGGAARAARRGARDDVSAAQGSRAPSPFVGARRSPVTGAVPVKSAEQAQGAFAAQLAAGLPLPSLVGGQVATQPLLTRLCSQLSALGLRDVILIAPAGRGDLLAAMAWEGLSLPGPGLVGSGSIEVIECASIGAELRAVASVVRRVSRSGAATLICAGDLVGHTEALARLHRATATAALAAARGAPHLAAGPDLRPALRLSGGPADSWFMASGADARLHPRRTVAAAGSAFHRVHAPDAAGCGAFRVSAGDGDELAAAADELAGLAAGDLIDEGRRPGFTDSVALLLVGLVRGGADVEAVAADPLICTRVRNAQQAREAAAALNAVAEDRVRLDAATRRADGLFTTCFVSPYSRYLARWAAHRRLRPNSVTGMAIALGLLAAIWFSAGDRAGMIVGAALLFAAFLLDCVDGQLARYVRGETAFGGWLDAVGGRLTEFAVYAGLAAGAGVVVSASPSGWELAVAAMILQSLRDMIWFSVRPAPSQAAWLGGEAPRLPLDEPADYAVAGPASSGIGASASGHRRCSWPRAQLRRLGSLGRTGLRWVTPLLTLLARSIEFQAGERVAVIGVAAIVAGPRIAFLILLGWGLVAACICLVRRIARSFNPTTTVAGDSVVLCRDDGVVAQSLGGFVDGQLPPLLPAIVGVTVTVILSAVGVAHLRGLMVLAPVVAMALAGLGSGHPHDGSLDWLVPPLLQVGEYVFLAALALAWHVPIPLLFALVGIIALHHYDIVYRVGRGPIGRAAAAPDTTPVSVPPRWIARAGLGWEGRMLVAAVGAILGVEVFAFAALAVYLWVLFGWESVTGWIGAVQRSVADRPGSFPAVPRAAVRQAEFEDGGSR
ncbi:MAG TPA: DUF5941 domain-containing protein [Streptosporangiaceae bacterium]|nr:DUF5941 domain-containing protein [Streptosporangiaceae bacterium]